MRFYLIYSKQIVPASLHREAGVLFYPGGGSNPNILFDKHCGYSYNKQSDWWLTISARVVDKIVSANTKYR